MKVLMITRDYFPTIGGVPTHTRALVANLTKRGVSVDLLVGSTDIRTALLPLLSKFNPGDYDVVHVQSSPFGGLVGHPRLVITVHSPILVEGKYYRLSQKLKLPFALALERVGLFRASAIICVSEQTAKELLQTYGINPHKVSIIPNGVDSDNFRPRDHGENAVPQVLICSRLEPRKNAREAIVALATIKEMPYNLRVVGEGSERPMLENLARGEIPNHSFLGELPEGALYEVFALSDIFLSTSDSEGFGLTVLEAMASGCAVLVSDIPVHRGLVTHLENGLLFHDARELVDLLRRLVSDRELRERLGRNARETALEYSWDAVAERTLALYRKIGGRHDSL